MKLDVPLDESPKPCSQIVMSNIPFQEKRTSELCFTLKLEITSFSSNEDIHGSLTHQEKELDLLE